jgi:hypothetical protein
MVLKYAHSTRQITQTGCGRQTVIAHVTNT